MSKFSHIAGQNDGAVLVTGAGGFGASWLVLALCDLGFSEVRAVDLSPTVPTAVDKRAVYSRVDITDAAAVEKAMHGVRTVFHMAALVPYNLPRAYRADALQRVNVQGTANVVNAAKAAGVRQLIYASSTGVVFRGADIANGDESTPVPEDTSLLNDAYSKSKAVSMCGKRAGESLNLHAQFAFSDLHTMR